jgi:SAM-dependent methyltransferase
MIRSWDQKWDEVYAQQGFRGKYPDEFVVRFVAGNFFGLGERERRDVRILDLGCGPGRHVIFLAKEKFESFGIDASAEAIRLCRRKLTQERLKATVRVGDFIRLPYKDNHFHAVIDCASVQHNRFFAVKDIAREVQRVLMPGGRFFSMVRTNHDYACRKGRKVEPGTFTDYEALDLKGVGLVHFFTERELHEVFAVFSRYSYEYTERTLENRTKRITHWVISAEKEGVLK